MTIASVFAAVSQQCQAVVNVRLLHGQEIPVFPLKVFDPRHRAECVDRHKQSMHIYGLDQFVLRLRLGRLAPVAF